MIAAMVTGTTKTDHVQWDVFSPFGHRNLRRTDCSSSTAAANVRVCTSVIVHPFTLIRSECAVENLCFGVASISAMCWSMTFGRAILHRDMDALTLSLQVVLTLSIMSVVQVVTARRLDCRITCRINRQKKVRPIPDMVRPLAQLQTTTTAITAEEWYQ